MTLTRRTLLQGLAASGGMLAAPSFAQQAPLGCAIINGLDISTSMNHLALQFQMQGLSDALDSAYVRQRIQQLGGCSFSLYVWASEDADFADIVRLQPIRPHSMQADVERIQSQIAAKKHLPFIMGGGTYMAKGIAYGRGLALASGVPQGNIRALNIITDGQDDDPLTMSPIPVARYAAENDDIAVNVLVADAENPADAMLHAENVKAGPWSFAMDMGSSNPVNIARLWETKFSRDLVMSSDPSRA